MRVSITPQFTSHVLDFCPCGPKELLVPIEALGAPDSKLKVLQLMFEEISSPKLVFESFQILIVLLNTNTYVY